MSKDSGMDGGIMDLKARGPEKGRGRCGNNEDQLKHTAANLSII